MADETGGEIEIRIAGGEQQTWGDFQRGPKTREEERGWIGAGTLEELAGNPDEVGGMVGALAKRLFSWCVEEGVGTEPKVGLALDFYTKGDSPENRRIENCSVFLKPTENGRDLTQKDLRGIARRVFEFVSSK